MMAWASRSRTIISIALCSTSFDKRFATLNCSSYRTLHRIRADTSVWDTTCFNKVIRVNPTITSLPCTIICYRSRHRLHCGGSFQSTKDSTYASIVQDHDVLHVKFHHVRLFVHWCRTYYVEICRDYVLVFSLVLIYHNVRVLSQDFVRCQMLKHQCLALVQLCLLG